MVGSRQCRCPGELNCLIVEVYWRAEPNALANMVLWNNSEGGYSCGFFPGFFFPSGFTL